MALVISFIAGALFMIWLAGYVLSLEFLRDDFLAKRNKPIEYFKAIFWPISGLKRDKKG